MLLGGCALFSGIILIQANLSFFFLAGLEFTNIFTFGLNEHGKYITLSSRYWAGGKKSNMPSSPLPRGRS